MTQEQSKSQANDALDAYLESLLSSDDEMACDQSIENKPLSGSRLYHLDSHPARRKHEKAKTESGGRHDIERVERLLEDFNRRKEIKKPITETKIKEATERSILLQPALLQPEIVADEPREALKTEQVAEVAVQDDNAPRVWIPEDQVMLREDWSEEPFQTLIFNVGGLKLALPLIKLGGIHRISEDITSLFGKPDWFMGLTPGHTGNINIIDTARWVMPEKYKQAESAGLNYEFVILLDNTNWGLACSSVQDAISLSPDNVRWRATAGKRPWLSGMLIDEMCALLDVDTLIYLLEENFPR